MQRLSVILFIIVLFLAVVTVGIWQILKSDQPIEVVSSDIIQTSPPQIKTDDLLDPKETLPATLDLEPAPVADSLPYIPPEPIMSEPLPALDNSDDDMRAAVSGLVGKTQLFIFESFIRHFVVTIDNMTNRRLPQRLSFTRPVPGKFTVMEQYENTDFVLDSKNYQRYKRFIDLIEYVDSTRAIAYYAQFYSLFNQAYTELGYPERDFNDRFIQVVEHLLMTPDVTEPIRLIRPKVFYQFADPELEKLSAGQKILLRMGPDNRRRVKAQLSVLHTELLAFSHY